MNWFKRKRIYLDYAAATPVNVDVFKVMKPYWTDNFGNAGAVHKEGLRAKRAIEEAREKVARTFRVKSDDIIFTSGGTESNNLAVVGVVKNLKASGVKTEDIEIISTPVEHPSVIKVLADLQKQGIAITYIPVDKEGLVLFGDFKKALSSKTRLITIGYANSETGVVQDLNKLSREVRAFEKENGISIAFHTDACQAPMWLPCALDSLGVDMMSLDAGKCEGPKGVGILVKRAKASLSTYNYGGSQESGLRPGTEPTSLVVGIAKALEIAQKGVEKRAEKVQKLRDYWLKKLQQLDEVEINGALTSRLPNNVNISLDGFDTEFAVVSLDKAGIAASTKSACSGAGSGRSSVIFSMTSDDERASATIRFSLSPDTRKRDLDYTTKVLQEHVASMKDFKTQTPKH